MRNFLLTIILSICWLIWIVATIGSFASPLLVIGMVIWGNLKGIEIFYAGLCCAALGIIKFIFYFLWTWIEDQIY